MNFMRGVVSVLLFVQCNINSIQSIGDVWTKSQKRAYKEVVTEKNRLDNLADNWKDAEIPALQRTVANVQLANLKEGYVDPVFASLIKALKYIELENFSLLDAACASGYYYEVLKILEPRMSYYEGSDYSDAMIEEAKKYYPSTIFSTQDLTCLDYDDNSFDIVLLAGVIEHVPEFERALSQACRVAKKYVVIHRCPLVDGPEKYTITTQYTIETPKIYFTKEVLFDHMERLGFFLRASLDIYPNFSEIKSFVFEAFESPMD